MRYFFTYLWDHIKWIAIVLFCVLTMVVLMELNRVLMHDIIYSVVIVMVILIFTLFWDMYTEWQRYKKLQDMKYAVNISLNGLEEIGATGIEKEYKELLKILFDGDRKRQNEQLNRQKDMREYFTMWVHQIKTPIAAQRLLLSEKNQEGEMREELEELFRIEQYVEMALQYMRLDAESTDFVIRSVALDGIVREAVRKYARQFIHKKISLNYNAVDQVVLTDEKWLEFVIEQILSNAIKYTTKGTVSIDLKVEKEEDEIHNEAPACVYNLIIQDTGIGIRAEDLPRICEKGYTGYNGHADKRSTGIGLYLCSRILKKLGHSLTITSKEGAGTKVIIGFIQKT